MKSRDEGPERIRRMEDTAILGTKIVYIDVSRLFERGPDTANICMLPTSMPDVVNKIKKCTITLTLTKSGT